MSYKRFSLPSSSLSFHTHLTTPTSSRPLFGDPEFQHFSTLFEYFTSARSTFSLVRSELDAIRAFLFQFDSIPCTSPFAALIFPPFVDVVLRFRQDDVSALIASQILHFFASFYPPTFDFILIEPFFNDLISQSQQWTVLHQIWIKLLTDALEDEKHGPALRSSPFIFDYLRILCPQLVNCPFWITHDIVIFIGVFAFEPNSPECFDLIFNGIRKFISQRPSYHEIDLLAFLLLRIAQWPSFSLIDEILANFVTTNFFASVKFFSQFMMEIHERGESIERVFGITAADILIWGYRELPESEALGYGLGVLVALFEEMPLIPKNEVFERFPSWVERILGAATFRTQKMLAVATILFALKCEEMTEEVLWRLNGFWENIEPLLADEDSANLACVAMDLFLREFEKGKGIGESQAIAELPSVQVLIMAWEERSVAVEKEPLRLAFLRTFGRIEKGNEG